MVETTPPTGPKLASVPSHFTAESKSGTSVFHGPEGRTEWPESRAGNQGHWPFLAVPRKWPFSQPPCTGSVAIVAGHLSSQEGPKASMEWLRMREEGSGKEDHKDDEEDNEDEEDFDHEPAIGGN